MRYISDDHLADRKALLPVVVQEEMNMVTQMLKCPFLSKGVSLQLSPSCSSPLFAGVPFWFFFAVVFLVSTC